MGARPTKKQQELLSFVDAFIKGNGYAPSYREIMRGLGYKSVSTVAIHVNNLTAKGLIQKGETYSARSVEVAGFSSPQAHTAVEKVIRRKIDELKKESSDHSSAIGTLKEALSILGYNEKHDKA